MRQHVSCRARSPPEVVPTEDRINTERTLQLSDNALNTTLQN